MSFKRDTVDTALLRNLKFRRVSEILAQQIPEDEARLLSNGRLTCVVCVHRPIFDNINMLAVHRKGRRHIAELSKYLLHKRELQLKIQKSSQLLELRAASRNPGVDLNEVVALEGDGNSTTSFDSGNQKTHPLLTASPYSSCAKKRSQKIPLAMQRRMVLETPKLPPLSSALLIENSDVPQPPSAHSEVRRYLKGLQRKKPFSKLVERMKEGYSIPHNEQGSSLSVAESVAIGEESSSTSLPRSGSKPNQEKALQRGQIKSEHSTRSDSVPSQEKTLQSVIMEHKLKLSMAGWIWDKDADGGKWVKDPNVEFDSDEDEPPHLE